MNFLVINLYELGQFLRILLWIFLPVFVLSALITTYIHYRKKGRSRAGEEYLDGLMPVGPLVMPATATGDAPARPEATAGAYKGLLWLKDKYEQDREQATAKYLQLKEEYRLLKEKFDELKGSSSIVPIASEAPPAPAPVSAPDTMAAPAPPPTREELIELASCRDQLAHKNLQLAFLQNQLDQRISQFHQLEQQDREHSERIAELEAQHRKAQESSADREATIQRLQTELEQETARAREIKDKLESGGQLLLKLHGELDQLLTAGHNGILAAV